MGGKKHFRQDRNPQPPVPGQRGHLTKGRRQGGFEEQTKQLQTQLDKLRQQQQQQRLPQQQRQPIQQRQPWWKSWSQTEWDAWNAEKADKAKSSDGEHGTDGSTAAAEDPAKCKTEQLRSSVQKLHQVKALWEGGELPDYIAEPLKSFYNDQRTELQESKTPDVRHKLQLKKIEEHKSKVSRQKQKLEKDNQAAIAALQTAQESRDNVANSEAQLVQLEADLGPLAEAAAAGTAGSAQAAATRATTAPATVAQYLHGLEQVVQVSPEVREALRILANAAPAAAQVPATSIGQVQPTQQDNGGDDKQEAASDTPMQEPTTASDSATVLAGMREQFLQAQAAAERAAAQASECQKERISTETTIKQLEEQKSALRQQLRTQQPVGRIRARSEPRGRSRSGSRRRKPTTTSAANMGNA